MYKEEVRQTLLAGGGVYCEGNYITSTWVSSYCGCCDYDVDGVEAALDEIDGMCSSDWSLVTL
jgi:hypothetical protein